MLDEDPADFEALRDDLYAHFQPAGPVAEHLVEQVAASIWRLRRVPEIESGIYTHFHFERERKRAAGRAAAQVKDPLSDDSFSEIEDEREHAAAERDQKRAEARVERTASRHLRRGSSCVRSPAR